MPQLLDVFISSKMQELKRERAIVLDLLPTLLQGVGTLNPWIYEASAPASSEATRTVYLNALRNSVLYIGLFWNMYGEWTIDEFDKATEWGIDRLIFVKNVDSNQRDQRLTDFLNANSDVVSGLASKWFENEADFRTAVAKSIELWVAGQLSKAPKRRERLHNLNEQRKLLFEVWKEYDEYLSDHPNTATKDGKRHERIIKKAIFACKRANDRGDNYCRACLSVYADQDGYDECSRKCEKKLAYIAEMRLTHNCVVGTEGLREQAEVKRWSWYGSRNRDALSDALDRIEELIEELEDKWV